MNPDELLINMTNDLTRREGTEVAKKPKWDKGSSLWNSPTYQVEEYINILERKIVELSDDLDKYTGLPFSKVSDHIDSLEKSVREMSEELGKYKEKERLTDLWARGEIDN